MSAHIGSDDDWHAFVKVALFVAVFIGVILYPMEYDLYHLVRSWF